MPMSRGVDAPCSVTSTGPDRSAELARLLLGGELLYRRDLLSECLEWSGEVPFQRLEYLGDALLELAVRIELRHRYPHLSAGDLTALRSEHVNNRRLATLLVRRLGKEFTKGFFPEPALGAGDGEAAKRRIIHDLSLIHI